MKESSGWCSGNFWLPPLNHLPPPALVTEHLLYPGTQQPE